MSIFIDAYADELAVFFLDYNNKNSLTIKDRRKIKTLNIGETFKKVFKTSVKKNRKRKEFGIRYALGSKERMIFNSIIKRFAILYSISASVSVLI